MATQKLRKRRIARTATKGFTLDAHKTAIIVGLISLFGVLAAATISNWDKLWGSQPDVTEDLLAYNEQRRVMVEGAFDEALGYLKEADEKTTGQDAEAVRAFAASVREKKAAVQRQYDKVLAAIKDKKLVQADINKTELNTTIIGVQRGYDELRSSSTTQPDDSWITSLHNAEMTDLRVPWAPMASSTPAPKYILPRMKFPVGRERNKSSEFFTLAENARTRNPSRLAGALPESVEGKSSYPESDK